MAPQKKATASDFDRLFSRLTHNDSRTKVVDVKSLVYGCCPRLGDALAHNTKVTQAALSVALKIFNPINVPEMGCWVAPNPRGCSIGYKIGERLDLYVWVFAYE
jgi:hypothetical protein